MAREHESSAVVNRRSFVALSASALAGTVLATQQLQGTVQKGSTAEVLDPKLVEDLVLANHILANEDIVDAFGHLSVRNNRNPNRYLLARHVAPALVSPEDILEYDLDSNPIDGKDKSQYLERFIHGEIYKARPDVMSVVHSHSPSVIPFSLSSVPLRPVFHMAAFVLEGVPVFDTRAVPGPKKRGWSPVPRPGGCSHRRSGIIRLCSSSGMGLQSWELRCR